MFELNLGQAYVKLKRYGDAEAHHLRAISLSGERDYPLARYNLGLVYCHRGQKDKALEQLRRLESSSEPVPKELILGLKRRIAELN